MRPTTTKRIVDGGVTTQYDQKIVRLMRRSKASPDAAWVIWAGAISSESETQKKEDSYLSECESRRRCNEEHVRNDEYRAAGKVRAGMQLR